jgi:5-methylcytosine-specific restriction endonuclease McrA
MPTRPLSHEQRLRQQQPVRRDYRSEDARRLADPALALAKKIRSSGRWQKVRALKLRQQPLCEDQYGVYHRSGRVELAVEVDHIQALRDRPDLAYTLTNLRSQCRACHARKSAGERQQARR